MGILQKLASQTAVYGLSSILGRLLNYLLVPLFTYQFTAAEYGVVAEFYAWAGFFSVLLVGGFETGYFRFRGQGHDRNQDQDGQGQGRDKAYSTALAVVCALNVAFVAAVAAYHPLLAAWLGHPEHPEYVLWFGGLLALDAVAAVAFARLRAENRALRFAAVKIAEIVLFMALCLFFIVYAPMLHARYGGAGWAALYRPELGVGYVFVANLLASACKFALLWPQLRGLAWGVDRRLCSRMWAYSAPMVVIGLAGAVNEMLDRVLLRHLLPYDPQTNLAQLGIYGACYKLSMLMSLFVQAFRYAAEPFFFAYAHQDDAKRVYARLMTYFVVFAVFVFLLVSLFLDFFQYFIGSEFRAGLPVVPVLLMANLWLGVYVNLSVWYKLTDRTLVGAAVSVFGALVTVGLNLWWIPLLGYAGSAWATLVCYALMVALSYGLGQVFYPVGYQVARVMAYVALGLGLYGGYGLLLPFHRWPWLLAAGLLGVYLLVVVLAQKGDFKPVANPARPVLGGHG